MDMVTITWSGYRCLRCGHVWVPRKKDYPRICPKCKSPYWDKERRAKRYVTAMAHGYKHAVSDTEQNETKKRKGE